MIYIAQHTKTNGVIIMLTINSILKTNPVFILAVNYDSSLADMLGEHDRDDNSNNEYLADMTIQYHTISCNACLAFTVECLVSVNNNKVTIEEMNTITDMQAVYANNITELTSINGNSVNVWGGDVCEAMHIKLLGLIESQPIDDIPDSFIIESY